MKVIRKYDVFKELTRYADGDLSLGECIDNCNPLDLSDLMIDIKDIRKSLFDLKECEAKGLHYAKDRLGYQIEKMDRIIKELSEWGWNDV